MSDDGAATTTITAPSGAETNGVNPVPLNERRGRSRDLFAVWFAWNVSIMGVGYGIYVYGLGLSPLQAILAGVAGYAVSSFLVGILSVGGPRTGLPTLTQTRFAFGYHGNKIPAAFAYISNIGWKVTIITLASTTGANIFARLWPAQFATAGGRPVMWLIGTWFVVVLVLTMWFALAGHALIMRAEKWISWLTGLMSIVFLFMIIPHIEWANLVNQPAGSPLTVIGGAVMAMTMVGLGMLNYGGDFARYLPPSTPARGVIGWSTLGISLPVGVLLILGVLLAGSNPDLGAQAAIDPIAALTGLLPTWFFVPFSVVIVISLVSAAMTGIYSSGLALMAVGLPGSRMMVTTVNGLIIAAGAFYLLFISDSFLATFQAFLALIAVPMGTMGGIQLIDFIRQRQMGWDVRMAEPAGLGGRSWRWTAVTSLVVATVIGLGMVTSADPNIAKFVGFLLTPEQRAGVIGTSNVGVVVAMAVGAALYALLTFAFRFDPQPDRSRRPASKVTANE
ncbi:cytosine permease [Propionimicrobium sp. PCR01-08-3]|uniref:purine-cytosine permease family protein n=1 Tax=Propionimicrobium sp. PCR01-08-3 TaxID=3052086 RepID=UPI00255D148A|nr:cytosine permease [Propionimicrobium sp. PCR01-08-3]WIY82378.1 cytosine permease [Propionimicrobium sp. PCR01-08-3]